MNLSGLHYLLRSVGLLLPAGVILYYTLNAGLLPDWDYWNSLPGSLSKTGLSAELERWLEPLNEHYVLIPKIIYSLNRYFSGGWNVGLSVTAWAMAIPQAIFLLYLLRSGWQPNAWLLTILIIAVGTCVFTPRAYHNWFLGMSGVAWITANLFALASIASLYRFYQKPGHLRWWVLSVLMALLGTLSYTTVMAVWPTLVIGALLLGLKKRYSLFYLLILVAVYVTYANLYKRPMQNPELERSFLVLAEYTLVFLGSPFSLQRSVAPWIGGAGILLSLLMFIVTILQKRVITSTSTPWFMIQAYGFGNALMAAISRSGMGIDQAFSSRYATLPALFWLGLFVIIGRYLQARGQRWLNWGLPIFTAVMILSIVQVFRIGHPLAVGLMHRAELKSLAGVSLYTGIYDTKLLSSTLAPWFQDITVVDKAVPMLKKIRHVPFHGTFDACPQLGSVLPPFTSAKTEVDSTLSPMGSFDKIEPLNPTGIGMRVYGWVHAIGHTPVCIVLTNQSHTVRGIAVHGFHRKDIGKKKKQLQTDKVGWQGYARTEADDTRLSAYVLYKTQGNWYPVLPDHPLTLPTPATKP